MSYSSFPTPRAELEAQIVLRARNDRRFRQRLFDEPRQAVADVLGCALPDRLAVRVVEERPDSLCVVVPVDLSGMSTGAAIAATGLTGTAIATAGEKGPRS
jgi:hypothetical protein